MFQLDFLTALAKASIGINPIKKYDLWTDYNGNNRSGIAVKLKHNKIKGAGRRKLAGTPFLISLRNN